MMTTQQTPKYPNRASQTLALHSSQIRILHCLPDPDPCPIGTDRPYGCISVVMLRNRQPIMKSHKFKSNVMKHKFLGAPRFLLLLTILPCRARSLEDCTCPQIPLSRRVVRDRKLCSFSSSLADGLVGVLRCGRPFAILDALFDEDGAKFRVHFYRPTTQRTRLPFSGCLDQQLSSIAPPSHHSRRM